MIELNEQVFRGTYAMPEAEFEMYLNVLSRLMRLNPKQRLAIADELRDHLEARLAELIAAGHSRDEAIRLALADLGDTAGLANDFRAVSQVKTRKRVVRYSLGTVAVLVAGLFLVSAFWPVARELAPPISVAQSHTAVPIKDLPRKSEQPDLMNESLRTELAPPLVANLDELSIEQRLDLKMSVDLDDTLENAIKFLGDRTGIDFVIDQKLVQNSSLTSPVKLKIVNQKLTARTILELLFEQLLDRADFSVVDNAFVQIRDQYNTQLYDCRAMAMVEKLPGTIVKNKTGVDGYVTPFFVATHAGGPKLVDIIQGTIEPASWMDNGGSGTINEFAGVIFVQNTGSARRRIQELIVSLKSLNSKPAQKTTQP